MKKFRFTLRAVAIQRNLREGERRQAFSVTVRAHAAATAALADIVARVGEITELIAAQRSGRFRAADQAAFLQVLEEERVREAEMRKKLEQARLAMEEARQKWIESRRDLRLVDTLETKARVAHRQAGEREEQALLDDRVNALSARQGGVLQ